MKRRILVSLCALMATTLAPLSQALAKEVVIGVIYPLSGPVAQVGIDAVAALKTAIEIINEDVNVNVPLGPGKGLPNLGGATIRIVVADHQGKPEIGVITSYSIHYTKLYEFLIILAMMSLGKYFTGLAMPGIATTAYSSL